MRRVDLLLHPDWLLVFLAGNFGCLHLANVVISAFFKFCIKGSPLILPMGHRPKGNDSELEIIKMKAFQISFEITNDNESFWLQ